MKTSEITKHLEQAHKIRTALGDHTRSPSAIRRPKYMSRARFDRLVIRLRHHEKSWRRKLLDGLR